MKTSMTATAVLTAARTILATTAVCALISAAEAAELELPQAHPEVAMDIPDGWTLEKSTTGFEMRSPEKNSIVIGRTLGRERAAVETWRKQAAEKLEAFGIKFDKGAKGPAPAPPPAKPAEAKKPQDKADDKKLADSKPTATKPAETKPADIKPDGTKAADSKPDDSKPADKKAERTSAFTTDPDLFTFSGTPSLKTPGTKDSNDPVKPGALSVESLTGFGASVDGKPADANMPKLPFHAVQIYGATMNGKPVDVQLLIYTLPANRLFVMMQESGSDDGRAVAMARSVRSAN